MTIVINLSNLNNTTRILKEKLKKSEKKGKLSKHFGKLKRNIDGLAYQTLVRENEDWFYCWHKLLGLFAWREQSGSTILGIGFRYFIHFRNWITWFQRIDKNRRNKVKTAIEWLFSNWLEQQNKGPNHPFKKKVQHKITWCNYCFDLYSLQFTHCNCW